MLIMKSDGKSQIDFAPAPAAELQLSGQERALTFALRPAVPQRRRFEAFTLISLLVVISVITLLLGVHLLALSRAKEQAKDKRRSANLKRADLATHGMDISVWGVGLSRELDTTQGFSET
jgi:hypothetical protein